MPKFNVSVPHSLGKQDALERLQGFSGKLQEAYGDKIKDFEQQWEGDRLVFGFKTLGFKISGGMEVEESQVNVNGELPFAIAMAKGQLTSAIEDRLTKLLN